MGLGSDSQLRKRKAPAAPPTESSATPSLEDTSTSATPTCDSTPVPTPAARTKLTQTTPTAPKAVTAAVQPVRALGCHAHAQPHLQLCLHLGCQLPGPQHHHRGQPGRPGLQLLIRVQPYPGHRVRHRHGCIQRFPLQRFSQHGHLHQRCQPHARGRA